MNGYDAFCSLVFIHTSQRGSGVVLYVREWFGCLDLNDGE